MSSRSLAVVALVAALGVSLGMEFPRWVGPVLDPLLPHGGVPLAKNTTYANLYRATKQIGTYNMAPMIDYHQGQFLATWKNSPSDEDQPGQRILYSQSTDGRTWTPTDGTNILFPNMSTASNPAALFAEPILHINGRVYAAASPHQFCLYPIQNQVPKLGQASLLLREVLLPGLHRFGPIFWATASIPPGFEAATAAHGIVTLDRMDAQTQADIATLSDTSKVPCGPTTDSLKCEACLGGCQSAANFNNMTRELTHYVCPNGEGDVLLYRVPTNEGLHLAASIRPAGGNWTVAKDINFPDDHANINAGSLPGNRVYLLSNAMPFLFRDPLFVSSSSDGIAWSTLTALTSCELPMYTAPDQPYGCQYRHRGGAKQGGCEYPQGLSVTAPAVEGFYAIYSLNKEDIWVVHVPFSSIL